MMKDANDRVLGGGDKVKGAIRSLIHKLKERPKNALKKWRLFVEAVKKGKVLDAVKAQKLAACLARVPLRRMKDGAERILGDGSRVKGAMRSLIHKLVQQPKTAIAKWLEFVSAVKKHTILDAYRATKLKLTLSNITRAILQDSFVGTVRPKTVIPERVIKKVKSMFAIHLLATKDERGMKSRRLRKWKGEITHKKAERLVRKGCTSFIFKTPLSYQSCFWRWKLVAGGDQLVFPNQVTFIRKVAGVLDKVQRNSVLSGYTIMRLLHTHQYDSAQFSGTRTSHGLRPSDELMASQFQLNSDSPQRAPIREIPAQERALRLSEELRSQREETDFEEDVEVNPGTISSIAYNKFSSNELSVVKQVGAVEVLGLMVRGVRARFLASGFISIRDEWIIHDLKEDNQILMDDMAKLQEGNEKLLDTFKESSRNFEILAKKLDMMRTERVIRVLEKVSEQLPTYEAFLMLKANAGMLIG